MAGTRGRRGPGGPFPRRPPARRIAGSVPPAVCLSFPFPPLLPGVTGSETALFLRRLTRHRSRTLTGTGSLPTSLSGRRAFGRPSPPRTGTPLPRLRGAGPGSEGAAHLRARTGGEGSAPLRAHAHRRRFIVSLRALGDPENPSTSQPVSRPPGLHQWPPRDPLTSPPGRAMGETGRKPPFSGIRVELLRLGHCQEFGSDKLTKTLRRSDCFPVNRR